MPDLISATACEKCRADIDGQLDRDERRLNEHSKQIDELIRISDRLTTLLAGQQEQIKELKDLYKELNNQINDVTLELLKKMGPSNDTKPDPKRQKHNRVSMTEFFMSPAGLWIVRGSVIILVLLVFAAIGRAIPTEVWQTVFN